MLTLQGVSQAFFPIDGIDISASFFLNLEHAISGEFRENALNGPLGNAHLDRHVGDAELGLAGEDNQNVEVIRQEGPMGGALFGSSVCHLKTKS